MSKVKQTTNLIIKRWQFWLLFVGLLCFSGLLQPTQVNGAPGDVINCSPPLNLSNSEDYASQDPFLLADPAGVAHLFWVERITDIPGSSHPNAIMYTVWNGTTWSEPVDIFLSPPDIPNPRVQYPRAVLDNQGIIHLAWVGPEGTFFYSSAPAAEAGYASAWQQPLLLASDQTGMEYSFDLAYEPPQTLHIVYGKGPALLNVLRSVVYIQSVDGGSTWSEPVDLYNFTDPERGASTIRVLVDEPNIYTTWTEWDTTGNGQAIYFARSLDDGATWDYPVVLAERSGTEYERDWTNPMVLDKDQLIVMWEGGHRAYPQAQYSYDGGVTWGDPIDTFYWLIADNGFAKLMWDHTGRLHTFLVRRIREGNGDKCRFPGCRFAWSRNSTNTLWHSTWEGGQRWQEPKPVGNFGEGYVGKNDIWDIGGSFTTVAFVNGNQVVTAWFNFTDQELAVMNCELEGVPPITPQPWPTATPLPTITPVPTAAAITVSSNETPQLTPRTLSKDIVIPSTTDSNPGQPIWFSILPSLVIIIIIITVKQLRSR